MKPCKINTLPASKIDDLKKREWSFLYAYSIKTIRDIFVYCALKGKISKEELYKDIQKKIPPPPPRIKWIIEKGKNKQEKERIILEYEHSLIYLGFLKKNTYRISPDFRTFKEEKKIIITENKDRKFEYLNSPTLTFKEKRAILKIILAYERARDYLKWFLDFSKYPENSSFNIQDFKNEAMPIFILGKIEKNKKGSQYLKRNIDGRIWKIPEDYIRLASYVFPMWFMELELIDRVRVYPDYSEDNKLWDMYYPIKMSEVSFLKKDLGKILQSTFLKNKSKKSVTVRIPFLLYQIARKFNCPVITIKKSLEKLYKEDFSHFYLERTSLQLMKKQSIKDKESYIKVDGFYRSSLKMIKRGG